MIDYSDTPFLETSKTAPFVNRLNWRCEINLTRNLDAIQGKRILDLACHDGRFSYACVKLGASSVTGVEGRPELVESAKANVPEATFICADLFDYLQQVEPGTFDTILCMGFFYHTIRQTELLTILKALKPQNVIIDTAVYKDGRMLRWARRLNATAKKVRRRRVPETNTFMSYWFEDPNNEAMTIENHGIAAVPTQSLLETLMRLHGFSFKELPWQVPDWEHLEDYLDRRRVSYILS